MDDPYKEMLLKHVNEDYPEVIRRLGTLEGLLKEINGGVRVLKFIGWTLSTIAGLFVFFKDHLFHLGK